MHAVGSWDWKKLFKISECWELVAKCKIGRDHLCTSCIDYGERVSGGEFPELCEYHTWRMSPNSPWMSCFSSVQVSVALLPSSWAYLWNVLIIQRTSQEPRHLSQLRKLWERTKFIFFQEGDTEGILFSVHPTVLLASYTLFCLSLSINILYQNFFFFVSEFQWLVLYQIMWWDQIWHR